MKCRTEEKAWGHKICVEPGVDILFIKAGHRCSWHVHFSTKNKFSLISGDVAIVYEDPDDDEMVTLFLNQDGYVEIEPNHWHEFRAFKDSVVVEYGYDPSDILRDPEQLGGSFCMEEQE